MSAENFKPKSTDERLWEALPTEPIPNLEEMKIEAEVRHEWEAAQAMFPASTERVFELAYRKGRIAGRDAANREILGKR
jgi:hypothetical protein